MLVSNSTPFSGPSPTNMATNIVKSKEGGMMVNFENPIQNQTHHETISPTTSSESINEQENGNITTTNTNTMNTINNDAPTIVKSKEGGFMMTFDSNISSNQIENQIKPNNENISSVNVITVENSKPISSIKQTNNMITQQINQQSQTQQQQQQQTSNLITTTLKPISQISNQQQQTNYNKVESQQQTHPIVIDKKQNFQNIPSIGKTTSFTLQSASSTFHQNNNNNTFNQNTNTTTTNLRENQNPTTTTTGISHSISLQDQLSHHNYNHNYNKHAQAQHQHQQKEQQHSIPSFSQIPKESTNLGTQIKNTFLESIKKAASQLRPQHIYQDIDRSAKNLNGIEGEPSPRPVVPKKSILKSPSMEFPRYIDEDSVVPPPPPPRVLKRYSRGPQMYIPPRDDNEEPSGLYPQQPPPEAPPLPQGQQQQQQQQQQFTQIQQMQLQHQYMKQQQLAQLQQQGNPNLKRPVQIPNNGAGLSDSDRLTAINTIRNMGGARRGGRNFPQSPSTEYLQRLQAATQYGEEPSTDDLTALNTALNTGGATRKSRAGSISGTQGGMSKSPSTEGLDRMGYRQQQQGVNMGRVQSQNMSKMNKSPSIDNLQQQGQNPFRNPLQQQQYQQTQYLQQQAYLQSGRWKQMPASQPNANRANGGDNNGGGMFKSSSFDNLALQERQFKEDKLLQQQQQATQTQPQQQRDQSHLISSPPSIKRIPSRGFVPSSSPLSNQTQQTNFQSSIQPHQQQQQQQQFQQPIQQYDLSKLQQHHNYYNQPNFYTLSSTNPFADQIQGNSNIRTINTVTTTQNGQPLKSQLRRPSGTQQTTFAEYDQQQARQNMRTSWNDNTTYIDQQSQPKSQRSSLIVSQEVVVSPVKSAMKKVPSREANMNKVPSDPALQEQLRSQLSATNPFRSNSSMNLAGTDSPPHHIQQQQQEQLQSQLDSPIKSSQSQNQLNSIPDGQTTPLVSPEKNSEQSTPSPLQQTSSEIGQKSIIDTTLNQSSENDGLLGPSQSDERRAAALLNSTQENDEEDDVDTTPRTFGKIRSDFDMKKFKKETADGDNMVELEEQIETLTPSSSNGEIKRSLSKAHFADEDGGSLTHVFQVPYSENWAHRYYRKKRTQVLVGLCCACWVAIAVAVVASLIFFGPKA